MKTEGRKIGDIGEAFAVEYLKSKSYKVLERNYSKPFGEIDIISKKDGVYIFFEVKTSIFYQNSSFSPEFRVNRKKLERLSKICEFYCLENKFHMKQQWRVDVLSVLLNENMTLRSIDHIQDISFN